MRVNLSRSDVNKLRCHKRESVERSKTSMLLSKKDCEGHQHVAYFAKVSRCLVDTGVIPLPTARCMRRKTVTLNK